MTPSNAKIPVTIVTGFLGSGKTTLLRHILGNAEGRRIAVIVNEFGELGIDGEILRGCGIGCDDEGNEREGALYELANGCVCCTVQEEFLSVMLQLAERRGELDAVLIETSGLALPKPLVQAFQWPDIANIFTVDSVVTVVDGPAAASGQFAENPQAVDEARRADPNLDHESPLHELFEDQLSAADLVVLNKTDLMDDAACAKVEALVREELPPEVKIVAASEGRLPLALLTWIVSGWLSMNPNGWFQRGTGDAAAMASYTGAGRSPFPWPPASLPAGEGADAPREAALLWFDGRPLLQLRDARARVRVIDAVTGEPATVAKDDVLRAAARLRPGSNITEAVLQTREDLHWYGHHRERVVPVWRLQFDDPACSWIYIDPSSGQVAGSSDASSRLRRWLFNAAHSLDFPWLIQHRPAWDLVMWLLSIVGAVASASGVVIGWRRLRRKPKPAAVPGAQPALRRS